jgi:histidinol-phosphate/aromatic aminotransferase/cobyric acid decarboxylase-like protein
MENPFGEVPGFDFDANLIGLPETELQDSFKTFCFGGNTPTNLHDIRFSGSYVRSLETLMRQTGEGVVSWRYVTPMVPDISYANASPYKNDFIKSAIRTGHTEMNVDDISGTDVSGGMALNFIANPSVPTGHLYEREEVIEFISTVPNDGIVIVDESYLPFCGEFWQDNSVMSRIDVLQSHIERGVKIAVVCDWSKFFPSGGKCFMTSVTILNNAWSMAIQLTQAKWPISDLSKLYLRHCFATTTYASQTYLLLRNWRSLIVAQLEQIVPLWTFQGNEWMPWVWMRADNEDAIERLHAKLLTRGITVLLGRRVGGDDRCMAIMVAEGSVLADFYVTFSRYAVEMPLGQEFTSFRTLIANLFQNIETIPVSTAHIIPHKHFSVIAYGKYLKSYQTAKAVGGIGTSLLNLAKDPGNPIVPIITAVIYVGVEQQKYVIIDGHSRYEVMKELWPGSKIPVHVVDYMSPHIFANTIDRLPYTSHNPNERNLDEKNVILSTVNAGNKLPVTRNSHQILCAGQLFPIHIITTTFNTPAGADVVEDDGEGEGAGGGAGEDGAGGGAGEDGAGGGTD